MKLVTTRINHMTHYVGEDRLLLRERLLELESEFGMDNLYAEFTELEQKVKQLQVVNTIRTITAQAPYRTITEMIQDKERV